MKRIAIIVAGRVENVVAQPDDYTPKAGEVDVTSLPVGPGASYDGSNFGDPLPNNPGNPYFGKPPKIPKDFWGLVLQVYIQLGGSNEAGLDRQSRLLTSRRAQPIIKIADSVDTIDPDDKAGAFLQMVALLTGTNHETDSQKLMEAAELAAIMGAWK